MRPIIRGFAILHAIAVSLIAGQSSATLSGTVADPARAAIPNAAVTLLTPDGARIASTRSDQSGAWSFPVVTPGAYQLQLDEPGFAAYRQLGIQLGPGASVTANIVLQLESRREMVTVTEQANAVETGASELGGHVASSSARSIPVNGRSFTDLLAILPGVAPASSQQPNAVVMSGCTNAPPSGDLNPGNLSVSGQRETANGFRINGASAQEDFNMGASIVPNLDSIEDLQVLTGAYTAEYGNFSGGQVLVATRSGSNEFHGSLFNFTRNTSLDARNFFASERAAYRRQQPGGTFGGPIRRDRVFFFADYQDTRLQRGVETGLIAVPTAANRLGDFSAQPYALSGTVNGGYWADQLSRKLGYAVTPGEPYYTANCNSIAQCVFPGAKIPARVWSAPSRALLPYIPSPNHGDGVFATSAENQTLRDDKGAVRIDAATRAGQLSAYYFVDDYRLDNPYPTAQGGANVPGFNAISEGRSQLASASLVSVFGATRVNELHIGYTRSANNIGQPVGGVGQSLLSQGFVDDNGKSSIVALSPSIEGVENVSFNDFTIGVDTTGARQVNNTYQVTDHFSLTHGAHLAKFGVSLHLDQVNINPNAIYNGSFLFQGTETGSDFADFLLGVASSYSQGDSHAFYLRNQYVGLFAQDQWKLGPTLTLSYGLRWDLLPPWREKLNQLQTLLPGVQSRVYPNAPAGLVFPGDPGIPSTLSPASHRNFAPRAGLAWSPNFANPLGRALLGAPGKVVVRAGFGLYFTAIEGLSAGIMSANPPYGYDYTSTAPPLFTNPFVTAASGENVGQKFPEPIPASGATAARPNSTVDWTSYLPITGVPAFYSRNSTPYTENYSFSIQREIAPSTVVTAGYVGSQAHHLLVLVSANPGDPAACLALSRASDVAPGSPTCGAFGESGVYTTAAGKTVIGTRPLFGPDFAAVTYQKTIGNSNYNSLELSLRHSAAKRDLSLSYTYGKSIDQSSSLAEPVNPVNASLSRAVSAFDLRHNFVAAYSWKLPGRTRLLSGWTLSGIARFATGLPVTLFNNNDTSLLGTMPNGINNNGVDTPSYTPGALALNLDPRNGRPAFNTALFSLPELGTIGTAARRMFSGPGMANFDIALAKDVRLAERGVIQLRFETFNALNHAQFFGAASVDGNITSANFGRIESAMAPRLVQLAARFSF